MPAPHETPPTASSAHLPFRLRRFALTVVPVLGLLNAYIGWRLLPALPIGVAGVVAAVTEALGAAGAAVIAGPTITPWNSLNSRLEAPAGLQLTPFTELGPPSDR